MTNSHAWNFSNMVLAADDSQLTTLFHFFAAKVETFIAHLVISYFYVYLFY